MSATRDDHTTWVGEKFWKVGDRRHVWVVDAIIAETPGAPALAVLVSEDGQSAEEVDLAHLVDPEQYLPVH